MTKEVKEKQYIATCVSEVDVGETIILINAKNTIEALTKLSEYSEEALHIDESEEALHIDESEEDMYADEPIDWQSISIEKYDPSVHTEITDEI